MKTTNQLDQLFAQKQENILNIYLTAGFPDLNWTDQLVQLSKTDTDIIEIGMPYSDPLADGETIQQSSRIALDAGMNIDLMFKQIAAIRTEVGCPLVLMGYFNQILQYGIENFAISCHQAGIDGLIIPDLPLECYLEESQGIFENYGIRICFLIGPESSEAKIRKADQMSTGFLYIVSQHGITGQKNQMQQDQQNYYQNLLDMKLQSPRLIGFGITDAQSFHTACRFANGAIIGSAFIKHLSQQNDASAIETFIQNIRS